MANSGNTEQYQECRNVRQCLVSRELSGLSASCVLCFITVCYETLLSSNHQQYIDDDDDDDDDLIPSIFPGRVWHLDQYELFCSETNRDNFILFGREGELALCIQLRVIASGQADASEAVYCNC
uniref:Uncharacterized protein n=1 Tax=Timema poppense TaxID=170557 RepID=A0A7R9DUV6_TIMPO|nr:unnamed protein product [Timema poppensis]